MRRCRTSSRPLCTSACARVGHPRRLGPARARERCRPSVHTERLARDERGAVPARASWTRTDIDSGRALTSRSESAAAAVARFVPAELPDASVAHLKRATARPALSVASRAPAEREPLPAEDEAVVDLVPARPPPRPQPNDDAPGSFQSRHAIPHLAASGAPRASSALDPVTISAKRVRRSRYTSPVAARRRCSRAMHAAVDRNERPHSSARASHPKRASISADPGGASPMVARCSRDRRPAIPSVRQVRE